MGNEITRKLATIRKISDLSPIEGADFIEVASVDGWKVVVKKGDYSVGDLVIFCEIDSWIPHELAPFLSKAHEPREYNGVKGERLKTIRLKGVLSQGLLLPIQTGFKITKEFQKLTTTFVQLDNIILSVKEGDDVTEFFGIQKWEPVIHTSLQGKVRGNFPTHLIRKTDQERIQNIFENILDRSDTYEVSMKLDGSSMTIFKYMNELRVCSRNMELKIDDENKDNAFVAMALKIGDKIPEGFAFQGELCGVGIQCNRENFKEHKFFVFDIFDIEKQTYLKSSDRISKCTEIELDHVPLIGINRTVFKTLNEMLEYAKGCSINHKVREGLVWKSNQDPNFSFKVINNEFLLGEK